MTSSSSSTSNPNPNLSLHLTDPSLTPLLSSSSNSHPSSPQIRSLTALSSTALSAYNSSLHLNLGTPQRIIVETNASGPILLHSFIAPTFSTAHARPIRTHYPSTHTHAHNKRINGLENIDGESSTQSLEILSAAREEMRPLSGTTEGSHSEQEHDMRDEGVQGPLFVGTVVARSADQIREARRAANRIEIVANGFQRELIIETEGKREAENEGMAGDG
ncbi:hypothetical protein NHQ30_007243 [Ciborinia camelliae]|nr:hypothetical protein NHQ30_007243 [Ciborinia camelliae]